MVRNGTHFLSPTCVWFPATGLFFFNTFNILLSAIAYPCQNNKTLVKAINLMFVPYFAAGFYLLA